MRGGGEGGPPPPLTAAAAAAAAAPEAPPAGPQWRAAVEALPADWPEREDALASQASGARAAELDFASRRRAEAERREVLEAEALPWQAPPPTTAAPTVEAPRGWPPGAPRRPIRREQLWRGELGPRYVSEQDEWVRRAVRAVRQLEAGARPDDVPDAQRWPVDDMEEWAAPVDWDCRDPNDCIPLHLDVRAEAMRFWSDNGTDAEFFERWGERLGTPDAGMLAQAGRHGVLSGSQMARDTVYTFHHHGLRANIEPARRLIQKEEKERRVTTGFERAPITPMRIVAYNCVEQFKWKLDSSGELYEVEKHRVTTDDSFAAAGAESRNDAIARESWPDSNLCRAQHLGRAAAILKTVRAPPATLRAAVAQVQQAAAQQGTGVSRAAAERIALWALDLTDAYRILAVHFSELWQQGFVWADGVRVNLRCLFGTAHMVGFFQRVSLFVLAVARALMAEYDAAVPPSAATRRWMQQRGEAVAGFNMMYIDDALAASVLAPGERLVGAHRTSATLAGVESRAQAHQRITRQCFREAGWPTAVAKMQLGFEVEALGVGVDSGDGDGGGGEGRLFCSEAKRRGLLAELTALLPRRESAERRRARTTGRVAVDRAVGRCGNLAQLEPAANAYLAPMFQVVSATRAGGERPRVLHIHGDSEAQLAFAEAVAWWRATLEGGLEVPLAARTVFPPLGEAGVIAGFSDAAGEAGTGIGGYAPVLLEGVPTLLYLEQRWPDWALSAIQSCRLSMPAAEAAGLIAVVLAAAQRLGGVTHAYAFTDSAASKAAVNSGASGSPQLNHLLRFLFGEAPGVQFLAIHQRGVRNWAADALSRDGNGGATVRAALERAKAADMRIERVDVPGDLWAALRAAADKPQRQRRSAGEPGA